jgi:addiction module RelB/DinJ family antitoxin
MTATSINIYTDSELEARAQSVLAELGLDMSTAFTAFLTQVVEKRTLSVNAVVPPENPGKMSREEMFGCMRGQFKMADDFDAPMELQEDTGPSKKTPKLGGWEGRGWIADDFNAPMEEFKEYM